MKEITCSHCGKSIPHNATQCPGCGMGIDKQLQPEHNAAQRRFIIFFVALTLFCLVLALLLPR